MDYKLKISDLRKTYGSVVALARASVEMKEGEFLTLLGPSGSGKTTMLMMIAGLVQPDSGEIRIDGRIATYTPIHQRDIGMVFQNYALFPHLTVFENIAFPLRMRRIPRTEIERRVAEALDDGSVARRWPPAAARAVGRPAAAHRACPVHRVQAIDHLDG